MEIKCFLKLCVYRIPLQTDLNRMNIFKIFQLTICEQEWAYRNIITKHLCLLPLNKFLEQAWLLEQHSWNKLSCFKKAFSATQASGMKISTRVIGQARSCKC